MTRQDATPSSHGMALENIAIEFKRSREGGSRHYSERARSMVSSAIRIGLSRESVAKAAGVSMTSVANWMGKAPRAKQLKLVASAKAVPAREALPRPDLICVRLVSGVEMDFPRSELSIEFLEILSSVGSCR